MSSVPAWGAALLAGSWRALLIFLFLPLGPYDCAHRIALPEGLRDVPAQELKARLRAARAPFEGFSAEARLTYFGQAGRLKTGATLVVRRPNQLRLDAQGPHGGVVQAFATDGLQVQLLDLAAERFSVGAATAAHLDVLLGMPALGLEPRELVDLLFGDVVVPEESTLSYDDTTGCFVLVWYERGATRLIEVDAKTLRLTRAALLRPEPGDLNQQKGRLVSQVRVMSRRADGLPDTLRIEAKVAHVDLEVKLRDINYNYPQDASVFVLEAPPGVVVEQLPMVGSP